MHPGSNGDARSLTVHARRLALHAARSGATLSHPEFGRADTALRQYLDLLFAANMQNRSSQTAAAARRAPAVLLAEMVALQHAFQRVQGATPRAVLGQLRLELARQRLADPNDTCTVTMVAPDCGIAGFGRFAAAYAARYGELPS